MKSSRKITLVGDCIENSFNVEAMIHAAEMFGMECVFCNPIDDQCSSISSEDVKQNYSPVLALDNWKNAHVLYGYELPSNASAAVIAGNERRGISREMTDVATHAISIPMISRQLNCINVAAAGAVALYYLSHGLRGRMQIRSEPQKKRPEIVIVGGENHAELGSAIRSTAAFGWNRAFIEDRSSVWFGCDRVTKSEGRAAARRGRNQIRLIPCKRKHQYYFREAVIITTKDLGVALPKADLCRGAKQAIVIADESNINVESEDWTGVAEKVSFAQIETKVKDVPYHFRHLSSIALAEVSRQVGQKALWKPTKQGPLYESSLKLLSDEVGEEVSLEDLAEY